MWRLTAAPFKAGLCEHWGSSLSPSLRKAPFVSASMRAVRSASYSRFDRPGDSSLALMNRWAFRARDRHSYHRLCRKCRSWASASAPVKKSTYELRLRRARSRDRLRARESRADIPCLPHVLPQSDVVKEKARAILRACFAASREARGTLLVSVQTQALGRFFYCSVPAVRLRRLQYGVFSQVIVRSRDVFSKSEVSLEQT